ncbi:MULTISPECIES: hypothetical protein [unclassified Paenibacillus]|uniref:hypothetical protein n=1 Tax=unclassified Paenibacillus TaxID=185978 RepID=UPI001C128EEF|nr:MULTISPECIES: hypothetical protein [unclassified Paenibacillus]MBU5444342.1 hypothetical protein [Paenibacillus sp. MSJ-34]
MKRSVDPACFAIDDQADFPSFACDEVAFPVRRNSYRKPLAPFWISEIYCPSMGEGARIKADTWQKLGQLSLLFENFVKYYTKSFAVFHKPCLTPLL